VETERSILATILLLLLIGSVLAQPSGSGIGVDISIDFEGDGTLTVEMNYTVSRSGYSKSIGAGFFPVDVNRTDEIFIFVDKHGVNGSMYPRVLGLYDHLRADLEVLESGIRVSTVDLKGLEQIFEGPNATVIIPSQPSTSAELGLKAMEWVRGGGVLIAIGDRSVPFFADGTNTLWSGPDEFLNIRYMPLAFNGGQGMDASPVAEALGLRTVAPTMALSVDDVIEHGGQVIGYIYDRGIELTSHALFRVGDGVLIAMGGHIAYPFLTTAEDAVASDLTRMLLSSLPWICGPIVYERVEADRGQVSGGLQAVIPEASLVSVFVFEMENPQRLFFSRVVDTRSS